MLKKLLLISTFAGILMTGSLFGQEGVKTRSQLADQDKWKLEDIFASDQDWENAFASLKSEIPGLAKFKGTLSVSGQAMLDFLTHYHGVLQRQGLVFVYSHMRNDENKSVPLYQAMNDRARSLFSELGAATAFFEPELLAITDQEMEKLYQREPKLELYRHYFKNIRRKMAHTLSEAEETILAMAGEIGAAPGQIFGVWNSADITFPKIKNDEGVEVQLTNGLYGKYQQSTNRQLRKDSYLGLYVPYLEHRNMLAANYSALVKSHVFFSKSKKYGSSLEAALDGNTVPVEVYHNLLSAVHDQIGTLHRYVSIRKKLMNLTEVHDYDLRAPLASSEQKNYSWQEAMQMCLEGLQPLGKDYLEVLNQGFTQGWVDVYETKGKRGGAYSSGSYGVHPYVLMNYNESLGDVFTIAHEMGHALHTYYTQKNQPFVYGDYPIFLAEVASTANEALLQDYLVKKAPNTQEKLALVNAYLDQFNGTFFRQALFAEFELKSHEMVEKGEALTADKLDSLFGDLYQFYYGSDFTMDRETSAMWSRIPHFYYNFYVFQYSTSFVASNALASKIIEEGEPAQKKFLAFLSSGNTMDPVETLQLAGVDMSTSEPVVRTIKRMEKLLDLVEDLTKSK